MTAAPDVTVTRLREEEIPEVIRLKAQVYDRPADEVPAYYLWKFFANPHRGERVPFWLLRDRGRLIGGIGALPVRMLLEGREIRGEFACDMFIERGQQRSGLGSALMDAYIADSPLPLMMNTSPSLHRFLVKRGFVDLGGDLSFWFRPLDAGALLRARSPGWKGGLLRLAGPLADLALGARTALRRPRPDPGVTVEEVPGFGPWVHDVWTRAAAGYSIVVVRDLPYLRWKYEQHPLVKYRVFQAKRGGEIAGYMVWRVRTDAGARLAVIPELFAGREDSGARHALLRRAIDEARAHRAAGVKALFSDAATRRDLRLQGFLGGGSSPGFLVPAPKDPGVPDVRGFERWALSGGDSDLDYGA